jgi:hypothetical protein
MHLYGDDVFSRFEQERRYDELVNDRLDYASL